MLNKEMEHLFEREELWLILMDGKKNDPERGLHLGVLIKLIEDNLGHLVPSQFDHHPHPSLSDSSRILAMPSITFSWTNSATLSMSLALLV